MVFAGKFAAGLAACFSFGFFAFVRGTRVPLLGLVDLGFHEFGHMVTYWLPDVITASMGSITQVMVPVGLATYFLVFRKDRLGGGVCLAWAATSAQDASVYIADAPYQRLHLIGGTHDWAFVLGPEHLNMLSSAHTIAAGGEGVRVPAAVSRDRRLHSGVAQLWIEAGGVSREVADRGSMVAGGRGGS